MVLEVTLLAGVIAAVLAGYLVNRWRSVPVLAALGIAAIAVDVSSRDLTSGGHDDRGLVAFTEGAMLLVALALIGAGVALRRWRERDPGRGAGVSSPPGRGV
jgi:hypothetical protein